MTETESKHHNLADMCAVPVLLWQTLVFSVLRSLGIVSIFYDVVNKCHVLLFLGVKLVLIYKNN